MSKKDNPKRTPLSWAAERGNTGTAKILIKEGANIESKEVGGSRPLCWTIYSDREDFIKLLLDRKAEIEYSFKTPCETLEKGDQPEHIILEKLQYWVCYRFISQMMSTLFNAETLCLQQDRKCYLFVRQRGYICEGWLIHDPRKYVHGFGVDVFTERCQLRDITI